MPGINLIPLLFREYFSKQTLSREPEPTAEMDNLENVEAFHRQGSNDGPLLPVYHFNALASSQMLPQGARVLDLGSGTGQYLAYLARCRPDIKIVGLDLAPNMVAYGRQFLEREGLNDRVELRVGDMTSFADGIEGRVDLVSSVFSLHHLPTVEHLKQCFNEIKLIRERSNCGVWIFDHIRPKTRKTAEVFPNIFTPKAPDAFKQDSTNSLIASFSFGEMCGLLDEAAIGDFHHQASRWMKLYQVHKVDKTGENALNSPSISNFIELNRSAKADFSGLKSLFPGLF